MIAAAAGGGAALALRHPGTTGSGTTANTVKPSPKTPFGSVNALNTLSTTLPSGWTTDAVRPSDTGTAGGFSIDVPPGWSETRSGLATHFDGPNGIFLEVDLTPHTYQNMVTEAQYIKKQSLAKGAFPGYKQNHLQGVPVRGTQGSFWQFTWTPAGDVKQLTGRHLVHHPDIGGTAVVRHLLQGAEQRVERDVPAPLRADAAHLPDDLQVLTAGAWPGRGRGRKRARPA